MNEISILTRRIYRNKMRIRDHFFTIIIALITLIAALFSGRAENDEILLWVIIAIVIIIISDLLMVLWHKYWIKKWRKRLTEITGIDYTVLDKEITNDNLTTKNYNNFLSTLNNSEKEILANAQEDKSLNLFEKGVMLSLETRFETFKEKNAIIYQGKLKDIKKTSLSNKKK